jgi:hypothetical protein
MLPTGTWAAPKVLYIVSYMGRLLGHWQKETCCAAKVTCYTAESPLCNDFPQYICTRYSIILLSLLKTRLSEVHMY